MLLWILSHNFFLQKEQTPRNDAIFYCYFEKNKLYKENFQYFLLHVVQPLHECVDFYIIINGECSVTLPQYPTVKIIRRKNLGYDFGAYSHCINHHLKKEYDYYIFMNSSVRGPIPHSIDWRQRFKELFSNDVGLVGVSINMANPESLFALPNKHHLPKNKAVLSHVQSMFFILKHDVFLYLQQEKQFFSDEEILNQSTDLWDIILNKEIGMSQLVFEGGWNINCILSQYRDRDYRNLDKNLNTSCEDPYRKGCYFGNDIQPEEAIFHKITRMV